MLVNLNQHREIVGTFDNRNYYHKLTLTLGQPCQNTFFLNWFPFWNISFLLVLLITVFLTLKYNSYRSNKRFHTLSFLVTIITIWSLTWLYSFVILLSADFELKPGPRHASNSIPICISTIYLWYLNNILSNIPAMKAVVFPSTTKRFCLCVFSLFNTCKNVSISN